MDDEAPRRLNEREDRAWRGYRQMFLLLNAQVARDLAKDCGLSESDYDVLAALSEERDHRLRISALASRMLWSMSRLSHHLTRMEQRGLVVREECGTDGRGAYVVLTGAGLRAVEEAAPGHVESVRRNFIDLLTEAQLDAFAEVTSAVVDRLADRR